ncbi:MAG: hypothetical protein ACRDHO_04670 [Actinomycetota bacterium]
MQRERITGELKAMERGRSVRFALAAVALVAVWSSLWLLGRLGDTTPGTTPSSPGPTGRSGRPPLATASSYLCPPGWPYAAFEARANRYYPPNHPLFPARVVRADRCYTTPEEAEAAGYTLGLPPPGGLVVDGVYLVFVNLDRQCGRAASRLGFRVPCPTRLPNPGSGSQSARCGDRSSFRLTRPPCIHEGNFLLDQADFGVPPGYGAGALGAHLVITASRGEDPGVAPAVLGCSDARVVGSIIVRPLNVNRYLPALLLVCPEGVLPLDEYLILGWTDSGVVYQMALNGDIPTNRRLLEAIAANTQMVGPAPAPQQP